MNIKEIKSFLLNLKRDVPDDDLQRRLAKERVEYINFNAGRFKITFEKALQYIEKNDKILCVGCEPSFLAILFMKYITKNILGTEVPKFGNTGKYYAKYKDKKRNEEYNTPIYLLDAGKDKMPFKEDSLDAVTVFEVIEHMLNSPKFLFEEAYRVLKKNGILLLTTPNAQHWHRVMYLMNGFCYMDQEFNEDIYSRHNRVYSMREVISFLEDSGFKIVEKFYYDCFDLITKGINLEINRKIYKELIRHEKFKYENIFVIVRKNE